MHHIPFAQPDRIVVNLADLEYADAGVLPEADLGAGGWRERQPRQPEVLIDRLPQIARQPVPSEFFHRPVVDFRHTAQQPVAEPGLQALELRLAGIVVDGERYE